MGKYVESCAQIRAHPLQSLNNVTLRITTGGMNIGLRVLKNNIFVFWNICGKGYIQSIKRHRLPYHNHSYATRIECPTCGLITTVLFFSEKYNKFVCRHCAGILKYQAWKKPGSYRVPKKPDTWFKWFGKRTSHILRKENKI